MPSHNWVFQTVLLSQHQVGFIRLQAYKTNNVGFIRITQPSQHTVGFIRLFIVNPSATIRTVQATDGFIRHSAKPSFTVGFSGCPFKDYTWPKHNKTYPSQYQIGTIRMLRQWKGRMTKLVAHSRSRDTFRRSI